VTKLLSIEAARMRLSIGRTLLYGLLTSKELHVVKIGRRSLVAEDELEEFLAKKRGGANS
jgi:excisionase family DNA binding protein